MLLFLALLFGVTEAQRPNNASICDYYAEELYGTNTSATQSRLIQGIVTLAYAGGSSLPNVTNITGILNPGTFNGLAVDLQPWFNGSMASTNLNDEAVGVKWIDEGMAPLEAFLNGTAPTVNLNNASNEFSLFNHFFEAFSNIFGCTLPPPPIDNAPRLNLAYVHKFMNLNQTDIGHFIDQFSLSTQYHGFSTQDTQTFSAQLNSEFNVRCAPPVDGQVLSLCQASTCPLAVPSPDCEAYVDLGPDGTVNGTSTSSLIPTSTTTSSSSTSNTSASTTAPAIITPLPSVKSSRSSSDLSSGATAGIAIGSIAVFLLGVAILIYFIRQPKVPQEKRARRETSEFHISTPGFGYASRSPTSFTLNTENQGQRPRVQSAAELDTQSPIPSPEMNSPGKSSLYTRFISDDP